MRLWEILKNIDENKFKKGTLFIGVNSNINITLEYNGNSLIYNIIMNDNKTKNAVTLCDGEMSLDYEVIIPVEDEYPVSLNKDIMIKNGIGIFDDSFIDCIYVMHNDKCYDIVPIEGKFAIPYLSEGMVKVFYRKKVRCLLYNFYNNEIVKIL